MTTYEKAGDVIKALVEKVMQQSHPELAKEKVTVTTTIARRESKKLGAMVALKKDGLAVAAKIGITSLQEARALREGVATDRSRRGHRRRQAGDR